MADSPTGRRAAPVVNALLAANIIVFALWLIAPVQIMGDNFLISWSHLQQGRVWTLLAAVFSHATLIHLAINMVVLTSFGPQLEALMGSRRFLVFYLVAGLVGSLAHAVVSSFLMDRPGQAALGASSALAGVLLLFALLFPRSKVLFFFIIPLPAIVAAIAFIGIDVWGLLAQIEGGGLPIGHGAHLGGAAVGLAWYLAARGRRDRLTHGAHA
jgi:membrane associated rhomboid family serine protease